MSKFLVRVISLDDPRRLVDITLFDGHGFLDNTMLHVVYLFSLYISSQGKLIDIHLGAVLLLLAATVTDSIDREHFRLGMRVTLYIGASMFALAGVIGMMAMAYVLWGSGRALGTESSVLMLMAAGAAFATTHRTVLYWLDCIREVWQCMTRQQ